MWDICELWCNVWLVMLNHVWSWLVCWLIQDPSWYSMDYRIYMGSSVMVWLPQWLLLYLCSYKLDGSITEDRLVAWWLLKREGLQSEVQKGFNSVVLLVTWHVWLNRVSGISECSRGSCFSGGLSILTEWPLGGRCGHIPNHLCSSPLFNWLGGSCSHAPNHPYPCVKFSPWLNLGAYFFS